MAIHKKKIFIFLLVLIIFVCLHIPGLHSSYQQDEYKWVYITYQSNIQAPGNIPHPPLAEFVFITLGPLLGANNYRYIPFMFGILDLFLIFYLAKIIFGTRAAYWAIFLFIASYYSLLATLMVDVDGAVMPLIFLIMAISYYKLREKNFILKGNWHYLIIFILSAVASPMIKLSGILPVGAVALDFAIEKGVFNDIKKVIRYFLFGLGLLGILVVLIYLSKFVFTYFSISKSMVYWKHFANSTSFWGRGWLQTFIQFAKSILYTSPLLIVPALFIDKETWKKTRIFFFFIAIGLIFYLFAFDFSLGALDRYFQFLVVPLCIVSAAIFSKYLVEFNKRDKNKAFIPVIGVILVFIVQFLPHFIPSLYPKTEWIKRMFSLRWNFLFPFSGGSGPLPFYVSFAFIALTWVICLILFIYTTKKPEMKKFALLAILIFGLIYNVVFIEEYLLGKINGNTQKLVNDAVTYIANEKNIKQVMVYNDNGGFEVQHTGKYYRRIYAAPQFEDVYRTQFKGYKGDILFIDIPKLSEDSFYKKYFNSCSVIYKETNIKISSTIYDCSKSNLVF